MAEPRGRNIRIYNGFRQSFHIFSHLFVHYDFLGRFEPNLGRLAPPRGHPLASAGPAVPGWESRRGGNRPVREQLSGRMCVSEPGGRKHKEFLMFSHLLSSFEQMLSSFEQIGPPARLLGAISSPPRGHQFRGGKGAGAAIDRLGNSWPTEIAGPSREAENIRNSLCFHIF